jgi:hypothetical protein
MPFTLYIDETCPKCSKPAKLAVIEPHPGRPDLAIHNFQCADCGPVKAKIVTLMPSKSPPEMAA